MLYLAKNGPASGYTIFDRNTELRRASVYVHLGELAEKGLVEWQLLTPSRGFLKKKVYSLTVSGLAYVFPIQAAGQNGWREIMGAWKPIIDSWAGLLPFVLGKWQVFVDTRNEEYAQARLWLTSVEFTTDFFLDRMYPAYRGVLDEPITGNGRSETDLAEIFQQDFYVPIMKSLDEGHLQWLQQVCASDVKIRDFVIQYLDTASSDLSKRLEFVRALKDLF